MTDEELLLEQVARAVFACHFADSDEAQSMLQKDWSRPSPLMTMVYNEARAVIAAMQPRFKAERIRGGEMVKEAAGIAAQGTWADERIRALSVPAIVEAGEHQPKEDSDG